MKWSRSNRMVTSRNQRESSNGFTLVELLVVITIIGVLVALMLPAVQSAREAARRATCQNNLKQIALGVLHHEQSYGHFPYGGWGHAWVGVADRGHGKQQPGGWIYNTLPFLELANIHQLAGDPNYSSADDTYATMISTPICLFNCPSRRPCDAFGVGTEGFHSTDFFLHVSQTRPAGKVSSVARADYAINGGPIAFSGHPGPTSIRDVDEAGYDDWPEPPDMDGLCYVRTGVKTSEIQDGLSRTYLIGEKFLNPKHYFNGESLGDNETLYSGFSSDLHRYTPVHLYPAQDTSRPLNDKGHTRFGSAHHGTCHLSTCDGSVRTVSYEIDPEVHYAMGHRSDGGVAKP